MTSPNGIKTLEIQTSLSPAPKEVRARRRLTLQTIQLLDVIVHVNSLEQANPEITQILHKHKEMFQGMGNIKNTEVKLDIDPSVQPVS